MQLTAFFWCITFFSPVLLPKVFPRRTGYFHTSVTKTIVKMKIFVSLACIFHTLTAAASIPKHFERFPTTPRKLQSAKVQRELGSRISNTTVIFGSDDGRFSEATARWSVFAPPHIQLVIEPGQESDVSTIVSVMENCC